MDVYRVNSVGVYIGRESLYWVSLESHNDGKIEIKLIDKYPYISPLDYDNYISQENRLKIFNILQKMSSLGIFENKNIHLSIDSNLAYIIKIPVERTLQPQELQEHLFWEFSQHFISDRSDDYQLSFYPVNFAKDGSFDSIFFLAIKKVILNFFTHLFEDLNLKIKVTDLDHFAAETICKAVYQEFENSNNFLISFKYNYFELSLTQSGSITNFRKIPYKDEEEILNYFEKDLIPVIKPMKNKINKIFVWGEKINQRLINELDLVSPIEVLAINPFRYFIVNKQVLSSPAYENLHEFSPALGIALRK